MAVIGRMNQQVDGLGTLRDLIDLVKNPKAIIEAHEEARKQLSITEDEQAKVDAAREDIKKADDLHADISAQQDALSIAIAKHEGNVREFISSSSNESLRLSNLSDALVKKGKEQNDEAVRLSDLTRSLEVKAAADKKEADDAMAKVTFKEAEVEKQRQANATEATRLIELGESLKSKAARLKEASQDL